MSRHALRGMDAPLPAGTTRLDRRIARGAGYYHPTQRTIRLGPGAGRLVHRHEKGHYVWHLRMSHRQRQTFLDQVQPYVRALDLCSRFPGAAYAWVEEVWAEGYARYKENPRQLPVPLRRAIAHILRQAPARRGAR